MYSAADIATSMTLLKGVTKKPLPAGAVTVHFQYHSFQSEQLQNPSAANAVISAKLSLGVTKKPLPVAESRRREALTCSLIHAGRIGTFSTSIMLTPHCCVATPKGCCL